jgi:hypothetical protein
LHNQQYVLNRRKTLRLNGRKKCLIARRGVVAQVLMPLFNTALRSICRKYLRKAASPRSGYRLQGNGVAPR